MTGSNNRAREIGQGLHSIAVSWSQIEFENLRSDKRGQPGSQLHAMRPYVSEDATLLI